MTSQRASLLVVLIMAVSLIPAGVQADELPSVNITTDWVGDGPTDVEHAYVLTFSDNGSYGLDIDLRHERGGALLASFSPMFSTFEGRKAPHVLKGSITTFFP